MLGPVETPKNYILIFKSSESEHNPLVVGVGGTHTSFSIG